MVNRASRFYLEAIAFGCSLVLLGLFAVAIFAESPYSIVALALTPIPLTGVVTGGRSEARRVIAKLRAGGRQLASGERPSRNAPRPSGESEREAAAVRAGSGRVKH